MDKDPKNYEVAYLLSPSLSEEEALGSAGKISSAIQEINGLIRRAEKPKKRQLAYAIKKERQAYFGWTNFSALPSAIEKLRKMLKEESALLRHLLVEAEIDTSSHTRRLYAPRPSSPMKQKLNVIENIPRASEDTEKHLDLEALDKKLEEILGK